MKSATPEPDSLPEEQYICFAPGAARHTDQVSNSMRDRSLLIEVLLSL